MMTDKRKIVRCAMELARMLDECDDSYYAERVTSAVYHNDHIMFEELEEEAWREEDEHDA